MSRKEKVNDVKKKHSVFIIIFNILFILGALFVALIIATCFIDGIQQIFFKENTQMTDLLTWIDNTISSSSMMKIKFAFPITDIGNALLPLALWSLYLYILALFVYIPFIKMHKIKKRRGKVGFIRTIICLVVSIISLVVFLFFVFMPFRDNMPDGLKMYVDLTKGIQSIYQENGMLYQITFAKEYDLSWLNMVMYTFIIEFVVEIIFMFIVSIGSKRKVVNV